MAERSEKFTPGPWKWEWHEPTQSGPFETHGLISEAEGLNYGTRQILTVCDGMVYSSHSADSAYLDLSADNAFLIAAAPDLYDALKNTLAALEYCGLHPEDPLAAKVETTKRAAAKTLARARGETQ